MKRYRLIESVIDQLPCEDIPEIVSLAIYQKRLINKDKALHLEQMLEDSYSLFNNDIRLLIRKNITINNSSEYGMVWVCINNEVRLPILEYVFKYTKTAFEFIEWDYQHSDVEALQSVILSMYQYLKYNDCWKQTIKIGVDHLSCLDEVSRKKNDEHLSSLFQAMKQNQTLWAAYIYRYENTMMEYGLIKKLVSEESMDILERIRARKSRQKKDAILKTNDIALMSSLDLTTEKKFIVYRINERHMITPYQHIVEADGLWTPSNRVNLSQFESNSIEGMSSLDKKIADLMAKYPHDSYLKQANPDYLKMLKGKDALYEANLPKQKVDVKSAVVRAMVRKMEFEDKVLRTTISGITLFFDKPITLVEGQTTYVYKPCDGVRELCTIPNQLVSAIIQLKRLEPLPLEVNDAVVQLVKEMSDIQVESDLPLTRPVNHLIQKIDAFNYVVAQFNPRNEGYQCHLLVRPSMKGMVEFAPGKGSEVCLQLHEDQIILIKRQLKAEISLLDGITKRVKELGGYNMDVSNFFLPSNDACLGMLETLHKEKQKIVVEWPRGGIVSRPVQVRTSDVMIKTKSLRQWFEIQVSLKLGNTVLPLDELIHLINTNEKRNYIPLDESTFISITNELKEHLFSLNALLQNKGSKKIISVFSAPILKHYEETGMHLSKCIQLKQILERIAEVGEITPLVPDDLCATLRHYQRVGYEWLSRLYQWQAGGCLADDMGLGKTLQTITLLLAQAHKGPSLIVVPSSVIYNWRNEIRKFAPSLHVSLLNKSAKRDQMIRIADVGEVVITSYGLVHTNREAFNEKTWNILVLDEAHVIKNRTSKMSKAVKQLQAKFTLLLTGTPVQNHLAEIWNLFDIAVPGLLGSYKHFTSTFVQPVRTIKNEIQYDRLKLMIQPFILRRVKSQVAQELPLKTEINIYVELSDKERVLYESVRAHALETIDHGTLSMVTALQEINKLRLLSCHPQLVQPKSKVESSKMGRLMEIIECLCQNDHIALVFSQFTRHLGLVRKKLDEIGVSYLYLDGKTSAKQRAQLVNEFNRGETRIFLISLKAGGVGLNLTTADFVIHLDPWWNPAIESQATDRAYRIGQDKPVTVYRMISKNTIEEQILALHEEKRLMADTLLEGSSMASELTPQELLRLLSSK